MSTDPSSPQTPWRRFLWELVIFSLLAAGIYAAWEFQAYRSREALALESERWAGEVSRLKQEVATQTGKQDAQQVEVAFRAFAAGLAAGENEGADSALEALLRVKEVRFVHLLHPDGTVIASSDRKLESQGRAGEEATWTRGVSELVVQSGSSGITEAAGPISLGVEEVVLWMGWNSESP